MTGLPALARLSAGTLDRVRGADLPHFTRPGTASIVHLGVGAFARAHLGTYADDLLSAGWPAGVHGISLRSRRAEDQLRPQDALYTVVEDGTRRRVVGALTRVSTGAAAAVEAIAAPATRLLTLTVTEKGYETGSPRDAEPAPVPVVVAQALQQRRRGCRSPLVVAPLDNLSANGQVLRAAVLSAASELDPTLPSWVDDHVRFACSVVDRIVPQVTSAQVDAVSRALGVLDLAAVITERHRSWVISDVPGLPPLAEVGVEVVPDVAAYERRKLWLLNGPHSAFAYWGLVAGCGTIAEAASHPVLREVVATLVRQVLEVAVLPPGDDGQGFAREVLRRFSDPLLGHTCVQVGADGSRKLRQRVLPVVEARADRGLPTTGLAAVVAAWLAAVGGVPLQGCVLPTVDDPDADVLRRAFATGGPAELVRAALPDVRHARVVPEVQVALERLRREGAQALPEML